MNDQPEINKNEQPQDVAKLETQSTRPKKKMKLNKNHARRSCVRRETHTNGTSPTISTVCIIETITDALVAQRARQYDSAQIFGSNSWRVPQLL